MSLEQIGVLAADYPATQGIGQLYTGAWSDRVGRKWFIASGMWVQAVEPAQSSSLLVFRVCGGHSPLGIGTDMLYPTPLASIGDVAHPV